MIVFLFIGTSIFSILAHASYPWSKWLAILVPAYLFLFNCLPAWFRSTQINQDGLRKQLSENWSNSEELTPYMRRYWLALEYAPYTKKIASRLVSVSFGSVGLAIYFLYLNNTLLCGFLGMFAIALYVGAIWINRPLSIFQGLHARAIAANPGLVNELSLSACALVAYSELFPDKRMSRLTADLVLNSELGRSIVNIERLKPLQI